MADARHIEWLKDGVDAWNARRKLEPFIPDFRSMVFPVVKHLTKNGKPVLKDGKPLAAGTFDLTNYDFTDADLRGVTVRDLDSSFSSSVLTKADVRCLPIGEPESVEVVEISDFRYTDLSGSADLTQEQVNEMRGDRGVILPEGLEYPPEWPEPQRVSRTTGASLSGESRPYDSGAFGTGPFGGNPLDALKDRSLSRVERSFLSVFAPVDVIWTGDGHLSMSRLTAINPAPVHALPAVSSSAQIEQLSAVGQLAGQIKTSIRADVGPNTHSIVGDIGGVFAAIEREVHKPEGQVLIVVIRANVYALQKLSIHKEALNAVDQALFESFLAEADRLFRLYPVLTEIEDPHGGDIVRPEVVDDALQATDDLVNLLSSEEMEQAIGPSIPGVTRDLAVYPWDSDRKKVAVFAAFGARIKYALEHRPPWVDGAAAFTTIISAIVMLLSAL